MRYFFILLPLLMSGCTIGSAIKGDNTEDAAFVDLEEVPCRSEAARQTRYYTHEEEERAQDFKALQADMVAAKKRAAAIEAERPAGAVQ